MNEIERIIKKGVISEEFLKEEIRNDFLITTERKKVWAVVLDLIVEFDKVCKQHNIKYYLDGGSLLGAIRHNGFIPWDDDIDVAMPRDDFERFVKLEREFSYPYFLQTPYTDPDYFYSFAKVRNSNTTALNQMFKYQGFNHGIWISIFPLDKFSLTKECEDAYFKIAELTYENSTFMRMKNPYLDEKNKIRVDNYSGRNPLKTYEEIQYLASQFRNIETEYWGTLIITIRDFKRKALFMKSYEKEYLHKFENIKLPIPYEYDSILINEYGNYMELPSIQERDGHGTTIFDAERSYKYYLDTVYTS